MKKLLITTAALASLWLLPTACGNDDDGTTPPPTDPDSPEAPIEGYSLYWAEEFDSDELNPLNWNVETGVAANQELQYYTDRSENLRVEEGCLVIEARKEPMENREYTSARINTQGKVQIKYGYIEARIWLPAGQGTWPAFWMMGTGASSWPRCGEIDIMEHVGKTPGQVTHALHTQNANGNNGRNWNASTALAEAEGSWNTYGLFWEQESDDESGCISFYVNGERSAWKYQPRNADMAEWPFDNYFYVILNLAIGGTMGGQVDDAIFDDEVIMKVDYVRMWTPNTAS